MIKYVFVYSMTTHGRTQTEQRNEREVVGYRRVLCIQIKKRDALADLKLYSHEA